MVQRTFALSLAFIVALASAAAAADLTIERMYSDPRLTGVAPAKAAWSPDGRTLAFTWNDEGKRFYDIWLYDASSKKLERATHASLLGESTEKLTRAEIDRLETQRKRGRGIQGFEWSPDGKRILFVYSGDLCILDVKAKQVKRLFQTAFSESDPAFSPDGRRVAFVRKNDLWMIDLATGETAQLTTDGSETLYNGLGDYVDYEEVGRKESFWWSPDGARIAYVQTDVSAIRPLLIPDYRGTFVETREQLRPVAGGANGTKRIGVLDVATRKTTWMAPVELRDEYICQASWHPGGAKLLVLREPRSMHELHFLSCDAATGGIDTLFTVRDDKWVNISNTFLLWDAEGANLYYTTEESGWNHLYRMEWGTKRRAQLTEGAWEVTALHCIDGASRVWFTSTEAGPAERHLYVLDPDGRRHRLTPGEGWYGASVSGNAKRIAVLYESCASPTDLYVLDEAKLVRVTHSPAEDFAGMAVSKPRYVTFKSRADGEIVHALVHLPPALEGIDLDEIIAGRSTEAFATKYPAIVDVHGGGYAQAVTKKWHNLYNTYLANLGYVVLDVDYRGSSGYGRKWRTDVYLGLGGLDLEDEMSGIDFLRSLPFIDGERIGMWGWSYGGFMTSLALLKYSREFAAGAAVASVTDWRNYDTHYTEERLGLPQVNGAAYDRGSPVTYADSLRSHLLLIHGIRDDNVHFQDTVRLIDLLLGTGVDFEVMIYPEGTHEISKDSNRIHLFRKIARHFERYMKGIADAQCR